MPDFQIPEPWSGHIESAPILFLAANPAQNSGEFYPLGAEWDDAKIGDFFENRFGDGQELWTLERKPLQKDGLTFATKASQTWTEIHNRAKELLGRPAVAGRDYAISDIVHCKSNSKRGVSNAVQFCSERYLNRIIEISGATVIVCIGPETAGAVRARLGISDLSPVYGPEVVFGRTRSIWFLGSPGSNVPRTMRGLSPADAEGLRISLQAIDPYYC